ncbi:MAG TPA: glycosyltransferase family 39 protein [Terracidiphilus sp.]|nr:glycosyltransferase family 39 protein [Terracidiphilus sp.]
MPTTAFHDQASPQRFTSLRNDLLPLLLIAGAVAAAHIATNGRYGFHRDELQFLADARHMDWGFVAYPPLTPFLERIGLAVFGLSMAGLRLFSVLAQATAIVVAGLTARELGGRRLAQVSSALVIALSPLPLFQGTEFQYSSFDYLWWVLIAYFIVRLLKSENPRWWLAIGVTVGVALLTKYSVIFFIAGILGGMLLSHARRWFVSIWFWAGVGIAFIIFLPNFLWQVRHDFISYTFLQHIHARDVGQGRADDFLVGQLLICINVVAAPLAFAGLILFLRNRRYRMLGWSYLITFALFFVGKGRHYYLAPAYPMLLAMGASGAERWLLTLPRIARRAIPSVFFAGLVLCGTYIYAVVLPIAASGPLREFALKRNGDLREEFGWEEMVRTVAGIRDSLPPDQQAQLGIVVGNYGERGAIELLGPAYNLPAPISTVNSAWLLGYPTSPPSTIIVLGNSSGSANKIFTGCRLAGHNGNSVGVRNEESEDHPDIFVCGPPRTSWADVWKEHRDFG